MNKADLLRIGREVLRPSDSGDVVEWLEDNVHAIPDSPMPGPFRSERTPWIAEALRIAADPETRLLTVLASIQSGKSLFMRVPFPAARTIAIGDVSCIERCSFLLVECRSEQLLEVVKIELNHGFIVH